MKHVMPGFGCFPLKMVGWSSKVRAFDQVDLDQLRTTKEYFNDTIMVSLRDSVRTGCGKVVVSLFRRAT